MATGRHGASTIAEAGMPFPFLPGGALLALAVLGGALTVFGLALRAMDRAITASRRSMLPGLVSGFRTWAEPAPSGRTTAPVLVMGAASESTTSAIPPGPELVEIDDRRIPDDDPAE
jgi:hypothetical protein